MSISDFSDVDSMLMVFWGCQAWIAAQTQPTRVETIAFWEETAMLLCDNLKRISVSETHPIWIGVTL